MKLHIGPKLTLPADTVTATLIVYGAKGMGKSVLAAVVCEELSAAGQRFSVIDPMGVFWGLRHSADGKGPGIKVLILGGKHGDIPIEPTGGHVVADLVADEEVSVVIDISRKPDGKMWSRGERIRFVADYCERLYARQGERRRPLLQIIDECGRFCPEQIRKDQPEIARCLGAVAELTEEARNVGVGVMLITQRSARMSKAVSELADAMIAFRTVGPRSVDAIGDWLGEHVPRERHKIITEELRKLPRGSALVVSPGWLEYEGVAEIRMRHTFDSSATPKAGKEQKASGRGAMPDLARYQQRMAETIERVKAADPTALRKQLAAAEKKIAELERKPVKAASRTTPVSNDTVAKPPSASALEHRRVSFQRGYDAGVREAKKAYAKRIAPLRLELGGLARQTKGANGQIQKELLLATEHLGFAAQAHNTMGEVGRRTAEIWSYIADTALEIPAAEPDNLQEPAPAAKLKTPSPVTIPPVRVARPPVDPDGEVVLDRLRRSILIALAQHPEGLTKPQILLHSGYRASGKVSAAFAELGRVGLVEAAGQGLKITSDGKNRLGEYEELPVGDELREFLLKGDKLGRVEKALLKVICDGYPEAVPKREIIEKSGYQPSGKISAGFARLVRYGYAVNDAGGLKMAKELTDAYETA